jgi:hypothetical protein
VLSFEELKALARGAVEAIEGSTPAPVCVLVVVANAQPHREDLARYAAEWNVANGREVARMCRDVTKAIEALA